MAELDEKILACFYDCDKTLTKGFMQVPMLEHYGVDTEEFWDLLEEWKIITNMDFETCYMNLMLEYITLEKLPQLSNKDLFEHGKSVQKYPGLPDYFTNINEDLKQDFPNATAEHYIISTGLKEMIEGRFPNTLNGIFASEFTEREGKIHYIARAVGFLKKTEFPYIVNKGANIDPTIDINARMSLEDRRVPFTRMLYVADGMTDVPVWSQLEDRGGRRHGVFDLEEAGSLENAQNILTDNRVDSIG